MTGISWSDLRALDGSQQKGFEQLCTQLAAREELDGAVRFAPHGNPDGGVECRWILADGTEVGWQAKFFRSALERGQWAQIDKSVKSMLTSWPKVVRYVVCFPRDLTNAGDSTREREADVWEKHKRKWEKWAKQEGRSIEFERWGESDILERLARREHAGRSRFWFGKELFSQDWFRDRLEEAKADLDDRYLADSLGGDIHVEVEIQDLIQAVGRLPRLQNLAVEKARQLHGHAERLPTQMGNHELGQLQTPRKLAFAVANGLVDVNFAGVDALAGLDRLRTNIAQASASARELGEEIANLDQSDQKENESDQELGRKARAYLWRLSSTLNDLGEWLDGPLIKGAERGVAVITGAAGAGKSHLLAHEASKRIEAVRPTILILAQQLDTSISPIDAMARRLGVPGDSDEFLGALDAAGETAGCKLLICIDALNETGDKSYWQAQFGGTLKALARWPNLAFVGTVRSGFEDVVLPERVLEQEVVVQHVGFAGLEFAAAERFFRRFGIQGPAIPPLQPEFSNPLLLYLTCRSLERSNQTAFMPGELGLRQLMEPLLATTEKRLSHPSRLNFDPQSGVLLRALQELAKAMNELGSGSISREAASEALEPVLYGEGWKQEGWSRRLLNGLLSEGLLAEEIDRWSSPRSVAIRFQFQLFEHWFLTSALLSRCTRSNVQAAFSPGGHVHAFLERLGLSWNRGILEILAIVLPERFEIELVDVLPDQSEAYAALLRSLPRRPKASIGDRVVALVTSALQRPYCSSPDSPYRLALDACLTCSFLPGHPLNADFLHGLLLQTPMPERDLQWSRYLFDSVDLYGPHHPILRLRNIALMSPDRQYSSVETILLSTVLAWSFSTSHRPLRDTATKALVATLAGRPETCATLTARFATVDDPYVVERVLAAVYGCVARLKNPQTARNTALAVLEALSAPGPVPTHILVRDYVHGTRDLAFHLGVPPQELPRITCADCSWPSKLPALADLQLLFEPVVDGERLHSSVWTGVANRWSDFSRYVMGSDHWSFPWSSKLLRGQDQLSMSEQRHAFEEQLTPEQQDAYRTWLSLESPDDLGPGQFDGSDEVPNAEHRDGLLESFFVENPEHRGKTFPDTTAADTTRLAFLQWVATWRAEKLAEATERLESQLQEAQLIVFREKVAPFIRSRERKDYPFSLDLARQWMLQRILDLGWVESRHGRADRSRSGVNTYRSGQKPERLGKKYQWIAWHSFLATASDCFEFIGEQDPYNPIPSPAAVAWAKSVRDIDPTCLLDRTAADRASGGPSCWWAPVDYDCSPQIPSHDWLWSAKHLPDLTRLFRVKSSDASAWFVLSSFRSFEETREDHPLCPSNVLPRRLEFLVQSYVIRRGDRAKFFDWAKAQNFWGRWMPYSQPSSSEMRLHEYWWHPAYDDVAAGRFASHAGRDYGAPCDFVLPSEAYSAGDLSHDCSVKESFCIQLPSRPLAKLLDLRVGSAGGTVDVDGHPALLDPSTTSPGPGSLLMSERSYDALRVTGYDLVWTVMGEQFARGEPQIADRSAFSGAWYWDGEWVGGLHQHAWEDGNPTHA